MAKITLFYGFIYLCKVNNRNHQWQQQLFLQKRTRWEPLFLIISTIIELDRLRVFSSQFEEDEIPVKELFRSIQSMPVLERTALQMATGRIIRCRSRKRLPRIGTSRNGKRSLRHWHLSAFQRSNETTRRQRFPPDQSLWRNIHRNIRYGSDADEWFGHHRNTK